VSEPTRIAVDSDRADSCPTGKDQAAHSITISPETNFIDDISTTDGTTKRKVFEINISLPSAPSWWRNSMTFAQFRQTNTFNVAAGATAAAAVVGGVSALPIVQRWRADALKRPGTFRARIAKAATIRGVGRRLKPVASFVLPYAIWVPAGYYLAYHYGHSRPEG